MARFQAQTNAVLDGELQELRRHLGLRANQRGAPMPRLDLSVEETRRLAEILDRGFVPPPELLESLKRLADPARKPPELVWADGPA